MTLKEVSIDDSELERIAYSKRRNIDSGVFGRDILSDIDGDKLLTKKMQQSNSRVVKEYVDPVTAFYKVVKNNAAGKPMHVTSMSEEEKFIQKLNDIYQKSLKNKSCKINDKDFFDFGFR